MSAPNVFPFRDPRREEQHHYLPPHILSAIQREAAGSGASDWAVYALTKLDRELSACSLMLTEEQVEMLHRYAEVLGTQPHELLAMLLAPETARRDRRRRDVIAFLRRHRVQRYLGCLVMTVLCAALLIIMVVLAVHLVVALGVRLAHP